MKKRVFLYTGEALPRLVRKSHALFFTELAYAVGATLAAKRVINGAEYERLMKSAEFGCGKNCHKAKKVR